MSNTSRQQQWQQKQREMGRGPITLWATDDEKYILKRILEQMRETGGTPASFRNEKGQYEHFDI